MLSKYRPELNPDRFGMVTFWMPGLRNSLYSTTFLPEIPTSVNSASPSLYAETVRKSLSVKTVGYMLTIP